MKKLNWKMYSALILTALLPLIYTTFRIHLLGNLPGDWGFNIASQIGWVNIIYEVLQEAILLPLFFILGSVINDKKQFSNRIKTGLVISTSLYALMSLIINFNAKDLLVMMGQKSELIELSAKYIRLETIAIALSIGFRYISIIFILLEKHMWMYLVLGIQMVVSIATDTLLVSSLSISRDMGVLGIAISNIIVNIILIGIMSILLIRSKVLIKGNLDFSWAKNWFKIGGFSGTESLVRNLAFMFMVLKLVNLVNEQGNFWVANSFIWGWILLPVLALGELIKSEVGKDKEHFRTYVSIYIKVTLLIVLLWLITLPLWSSFIQNILNINNYKVVYNIVLISLPFYIAFAINNVIDSIFYGLGRTDLMLWQSLIVNSIYYGSLFILYKNNLFNPNIYGIAIMFATGILIDSIITLLMYWHLVKNKKLS